MYNEDFKKVLLSKPHCTLGKKGITEEFITHVLKLLKRYKVIKIKILKSAVYNSTPKEIGKRISDATNSHLLDVRGKKLIISKNPINIKK